MLPKPDNLTCCLHIAKSLRRSKKTPDRLFDQLLGLSGHGGRDDEPERLDRVASENSVHRVAIASESDQLQFLSYSSFSWRLFEIATAA